MSIRDIQLPDLTGSCKLTSLTAGIPDFYRCEVGFTGESLMDYSGTVWVPINTMHRHRSVQVETSGSSSLLPANHFEAQATISRPIRAEANTGEYIRVLHVTWSGHSFGGETRIAEKDAWYITKKLNAAMHKVCERVIRSNNYEFSVGIRSEIQEQREKSDGSYVAVYSAWYRGHEAILKVTCKLGEKGDSERVDTEVKALQTFKKYGCEHAPVLLAYFKKDLGGSIARYEHCVVMTKVPGVHLWDESLTADDKNAARQALSKAISGNVIYDAAAKKCYIIDFEQAQFHELPRGWTDDPTRWNIWDQTSDYPLELSA